MNIWQILRSIPSFSIFSDQELKIISEQAETRDFASGEFVLREGQSNERMYVIMHGTVEIHKKYDDKDFVVAELSVGNFIGEVSILGFDEKPMASVIAKTNTSLLEISKEVVARWSEENPKIVIKLFQVISLGLSRKLRKLNEEYVKIFMQTKGLGKISELRSLQEKLFKEWGI
ncbi:MAG: cyclic nucleotide-binding domain-containing protein [Candidatus Calescibacterium sp.]|nr:cyclic nucleotide-binding domain-containing protein [Candidatus Calescibacterium sp.]MCX7733468.1 cyclic nucleotide-binding domain-containing protein [bacterium]MDW8087449.1 cyclic nucleotide-binding domain-containing protein [Candidatus Calescibacterium sp.]